MNLIPVRTPKLIKGIFPKYIWNMPQDQKTIYLTFDDGPTPEITQWTLNTLERYKAKATFFCIGTNIKNHPEVFNAILEHGHSVGNHTLSHPKGWTTNADVYVNQVIKTQEIIDDHISNITAQTPKLFRPPYGQITPKQGNRLLALSYKIIMWDILAFDWKDTLTTEQCAENVLSKTRNGSIVVFHDSLKASERMKFALPKTLEHFTQLGYQFKAIT